MALVRVNAYVWRCVKSVALAEDFASEDQVVKTWMRQYGVAEGDRIQAAHVDVDGVHTAQKVWVVVAHSGTVIAISEPPIGASISGWDPAVDLVSQQP